MSSRPRRRIRRKQNHRVGTSQLQLEFLETRTMLAADGLATAPSDVNADGEVTAVDALMVVNAMHRQQVAGRADVDGNGMVNPLDALMVINAMRAGRGQPDGMSGEPMNRRGSGPGGPDGGPGNEPGGPGGGNHPPEIATIDGTDNNRQNPEWGSTEEQLLRLTPADYADDVSSPAGDDRPSARAVSNAVVAQTESIENDRGLTDLTWLFGQFLDHDIDLTENADPAEPFPIEVPTGDPYFDPFGTGTQTISLNRSVYGDDTGTSVDAPREQLNQITAFIDGSVIYGSEEERAAELRTFVDGKLKMSEGDLLPFNEASLANAGGTSDTLFLAGDIRANENVALSAMHTVWVREHNRIAQEIADRDPRASDEQIYQRARRLVTAQLQSITFNEFLPALLGEDAVADYEGYDPSVNPGISNEFSTAIYRFGHSMLSSELLRLNNDGTTADEGNLSLSSAFFAPSELIENGIDSILVGAASQQAQEIDTMIVDDVRNFLFGPPGAGGFDLASLNIQRGRDHGLADYNQVRTDLGLDPVTSFEDITSDPEIAEQLALVYGDIDNVDLWVGALAEDHVAGASVGELTSTVIAEQFERLRDGDRFWYQHIFSGRQLRDIERTTLADVIERNTGITALQENVFFTEDATPTPVFAARPDNPVGSRSQPNVVDTDLPDDTLNQDRVPRQAMQLANTDHQSRRGTLLRPDRSDGDQSIRNETQRVDDVFSQLGMSQR